MFGIVDYGLFFNDTMNVRQGARDGARAAAVGTSFGSTTSCGLSWSGSPSNDIKAAICSTVDSVALTGGHIAVRVRFELPGSTVSAPYQQGNNVKVCVVGQRKSLIGFVPFPKNGLIQTAVTTRIERFADTPAESDGDGSTFGSPVDWGFCS